jgi:hypothetical protein
MANAAPRCGARSKRTGKPCRAAAMPNGRCKVHGGKSTGPRTPEGLERSRRANWKHDTNDDWHLATSCGPQQWAASEAAKSSVLSDDSA